VTAACFPMRHQLAVFAFALASLGSCKPSGGGNPSPPLGIVPDNNSLSVAIVDPPANRGRVVSGSTVEVRGLLSGVVDSFTWQNGSAGQGSIPIRDQWTVTVPVVAGDNQVVVTATGPGGTASASVLIVRDSLALLVGQPRLSPDVVFVNEPTTVRATVLLDLQATIQLVELWQLDAAGNATVVLAALTDNGDLANGDEIQGDGVFSARFTTNAPSVGKSVTRVRVTHDQGTSWTPTASLLTLAHLEPAAFAAGMAVQNEARLAYEAALPSGTEAAIEAACTVLRANPEVAACGRSGTDGGLWVFYKAGFAGGLLLHDEGSRGGYKGEVPAFAIEKGAALPASFGDPLCDAGMPTDALLLSPFFGDLENADLLSDLALENCPDWNEAHLVDGLADVASFRALSGKGLLSIASHGDNWFRGSLPVLGQFNLFGWQATLASFGSSVPVVATGEVVSFPGVHEADLLAGRLCIYHRLFSDSGRLAITPAFVSSNLELPGAIVYVGSCRSAFNMALAQAFLGAGAAAYLGYTDYVNSAFAAAKGVEFWDGMLAGQTVGEAYVPATDPGGSAFVLYGDATAKLPDGTLRNGQFECATLGAWAPSGDARLITQLGPLSPPGGQRMAIISTGLGFSTTSGEISQGLCVPTNALNLVLTWDFLSHEFLTYCGSQFQDEFQVVFVPNGGSEQVLFQRRVDNLCGSVSAIGVNFGEGGDPDGVYHTGFQTTSIDMIPWRGVAGRLVLRTRDVGDSIYDTAVLLDEIGIQVMP